MAMPIRRTIKNVVKNFSDSQIKVREATSNDPWGPSSTLMSEIADLTYNVVAFTEIMQMIWKRLNDHGKNWRHVYKALVLLDYIIKTGSEKVAQQCKENIFAIQTLKDFQHMEDNKDHGLNVREKAKQLVTLLKDDERLKNERTKALKAKERFAQNSMGLGSGAQHSSTSPTSGLQSSPSGYEDTFRPVTTPTSTPNEMEAARPTTAGEEELQLQLALAMSKEEHEEEQRRKRGDDIKLAMALEESKKEKGTSDTPTMPGALPPPASSGRHHHHQAQETTLLDLANNMSDNSPAASSDPWGTSLPASQPAQANDPWGAPASKPAAPAPVANNDPWSTSPAPPPAADPWGAPSATQQAPPPSSDPWAPGAKPAVSQPANVWGGSQPHANGTMNNNTLDDAFDLLSNRSGGKPETNGSTGLTPMVPGGSISPAFDLSGMNQALPPEPVLLEDPKRGKSPADFLGANANLVNLDNLVTQKPAETTATNPFALTNPGQQAPQQTSNPFAAQQQRNTVSLNQMASAQGTVFQPAASISMPLVPPGPPQPIPQMAPMGMAPPPMQMQGMNMGMVPPQPMYGGPPPPTMGGPPPAMFGQAPMGQPPMYQQPQSSNPFL